MKRQHFFKRNEILIDKTYGELYVLSINNKKLRSGIEKKSIRAKCSCGEIIEILIDNMILSPHPMCKICISNKKRCCKVGDKFDNLLVIGFIPSGKSCSTFALCKCICGNEKSIRPDMLRKNKTNNCGCIPGAQWQGYGELSMTYFHLIKKNASKRDLEFNVSIEYLWDLFIKQNKKCALTGLELVLARDFRKQVQSASIDRIDNNKGYVESNVWWVNKDINTLKTDFTLNRFIELCSMVSNFNRKS